MPPTTEQAPPSATRKKTADPIDLAQISLVSRVWSEARKLTLITIRYPARYRDDWYHVSGWSDGRAESCECEGWRFRQRCRHGDAFPFIVAEIAEQDHRTYPTNTLLKLVSYWQSCGEPLTNDQRLALGAQRAVLARRGVRVAFDAAVLARGKAAVRSLFEEAGEASR